MPVSVRVSYSTLESIVANAQSTRLVPSRLSLTYRSSSPTLSPRILPPSIRTGLKDRVAFLALVLVGQDVVVGKDQDRAVVAAPDEAAERSGGDLVMADGDSDLQRPGSSSASKGSSALLVGTPMYWTSISPFACFLMDSSCGLFSSPRFSMRTASTN